MTGTGDDARGASFASERELARELLATRFPLVADHPDVAGVLRDAELLALLGRALAAPFTGARITTVCAPEARGPILGGLVATALGVGLVLARKDARNHPGADLRTTSAPTWRGAPEVFLTRSFDVGPGDRVLVVDDWITSGSSIRAIADAMAVHGATYAGASVLVDKAQPDVLAELRVEALVRFDAIVAKPT